MSARCGFLDIGDEEAAPEAGVILGVGSNLSDDLAPEQQHKQMVSELELGQMKTTRPPPRHLSTFKGSDNNNNNNNNNNTITSNSKRKNNCFSSNQQQQKPPIVGGNSLESINSRYSISSGANDDSQLNNSTRRSKTPKNTSQSNVNDNSDDADRFVQLEPPKHRHSIHAAINQHNNSTIGNLYIIPPAGIEAANLPPTSDKNTITSGSGRQQQNLQLTDICNGNNHQNHHKLESQLSLYKNLDVVGGRKASNTSETTNTNRKKKRPEENSSGGNNKEVEPQPPKAPFKFAGILASLAGSVFFSCSFLCIKLVPNESYEARNHALLIRGLCISMICSVVMLIRKDSFLVKRDELWVNALRAIFGMTGVYATFCALKYISLGDSTALVFSSPIWTSLLSRVILKEPLKWFHIFALPLSIFGIVLIAHPSLIVSDEHLSILHRSSMSPSPITLQNQMNATNNNSNSMMKLIDGNNLTRSIMNANISSITGTSTESPTDVELLISDVPTEETAGDDRWIGVIISLGTSLVVSCTYIVLKFRKTTPVQTTTFWLGIALVFFALIFMCSMGFGEWPTQYELVLYLSNGFFSWCGQSVLQWAFLHEKAGILSIVRTMDVAMTFVLSALFLDDDIYWTSILGASIISLVVASIMLNDWIAEKWCGNRSKGCNIESLPKNFELEADDESQQFEFGPTSKVSSKLRTLSSSCNNSISSYCIGNQEAKSKGSLPAHQIYRQSLKA